MKKFKTNKEVTLKIISAMKAETENLIQTTFGNYVIQYAIEVTNQNFISMYLRIV